MALNEISRSIRLLFGPIQRCRPAVAPSMQTGKDTALTQTDVFIFLIQNKYFLWSSSSSVWKSDSDSAGTHRGGKRSRQSDLREQKSSEPGADGSGCEGPGLEDVVASPGVLPQVWFKYQKQFIFG